MRSVENADVEGNQALRWEVDSEVISLTQVWVYTTSSYLGSIIVFPTLARAFHVQSRKN